MGKEISKFPYKFEQIEKEQVNQKAFDEIFQPRENRLILTAFKNNHFLNTEGSIPLESPGKHLNNKIEPTIDDDFELDIDIGGLQQVDNQGYFFQQQQSAQKYDKKSVNALQNFSINVKIPSLNDYFLNISLESQ